MASVLDVMPAGPEEHRRDAWVRIKALASRALRRREIRDALARVAGPFGLSGCITPPPEVFA